MGGLDSAGLGEDWEVRGDSPEDGRALRMKAKKDDIKD
jgi:hypothetical protein